jgi:chitinase
MNRSGLRKMAAGSMLALAALGAAAQKSPREFAVVGYVFPRGSLLAPGQIDAHNLTRINYAFAAIEDGRLAAGSPLNAPNPGAPNPDAQNLDAQNLALLTSLRKQNPSLTVLVSVGGWLGSGAFSDVALSAQSRKVFVESAVDFLRRYDLDGLDVDWEYPGMPGSGHTFRPEDKRDFTLLLKDLRSRFDREEKATGRSLILTIAAAAFSDYLAHTEMKDVQRYADTVNLMTYDYAMPSVDAITSHNAPLFADPAAPSQLSADASILAFELAGVPQDPSRSSLFRPSMGAGCGSESRSLPARQTRARRFRSVQHHPADHARPRFHALLGRHGQRALFVQRRPAGICVVRRRRVACRQMRLHQDAQAWRSHVLAVPRRSLRRAC